MKFSKDYNNILEKAKTLSDKYKRPNVCPDLLLHSLLSSKSHSILYIFESLGIKVFDLLLLSEIGLAKKRQSTNPTKRFSKESRLVFSRAKEITEEFGQDYCGVESLLLALISSEKKSSVFKFLDEEDNISKLISDRIHLFIKDSVPKFEKKKEEVKKEEDDRFLEMFEDNKILAEFGTNLNKKVLEGDFDDLINHDPEKMNEIATTLLRKRKANVILVGEGGTGKSATVGLLAKMIVDGEAPEMLLDKVIYSVDLSQMVAGTEFRGMFEKRLTQFIEEAKKYDNIILFIDELHTLVGAGGSGRKNDLEASNILKPALANGELSVIGATTQEEYEAKIKNDSALDRRFNKVVISQPSKFKMKELLPKLAEYYEKAHGVVYSPEFLDSLIEKCEQFMPNKKYPDKAIDILDVIGAQAKMKFSATPDYVKKAQDGLLDVSEKLARGDLSDQDEIRKKLDEVKVACGKWEEEYFNHLNTVEEEELDTFFEKRKRIVLRKCFEQVSSFFPEEKQDLGAKIIESIKKDSSIILLYGDKKSGKTTLCRSFSDFARKNEVDVIYFSGLDFSAAELCRRVLNSDSSVVIIDDLSTIGREASVFLTKVIKDKKIERSSGEIIDFSNTDFILTCDVKKGSSLGFGGAKNCHPDLDEDLVKYIENQFLVEPFKVASVKDNVTLVEKV